MTDVTEIELVSTSEPEEENALVTIIKAIKARRWLVIQQRLDMPSIEIMQDGLAMTIVAAHEKHYSEGGNKRENWDRFLDMTLPELQEYLGIDGSKSDAEPLSD